jgi:AraC-like DNA-binding protein
MGQSRLIDVCATLEPDWQIQSADVRHVWHQVSRHLKPFRIISQAGERYHARVWRQAFRETELILINYGGPVRIEAGTLGGFALLQAPLRGGYVCQAAGSTLTTPTGHAHLVSPTAPLNMDWSADCHLLVVRFNALTGVPSLRGPIGGSALGPVVDLTASRAQSLDRALSFAVEDALSGGVLATDASARRSVDAMLVAAVKAAFFPEGGRAAKYPEPLARALAYLEADLEQPMRLEDLARAAGLGRTQLAAAFQEHLGLSPLAWVQTRRLDRVRQELITAADQPRAVTESALRWGFTHMGRFAQAYAKRFGESPRATVQRARSTHPAES